MYKYLNSFLKHCTENVTYCICSEFASQQTTSKHIFPLTHLRYETKRGFISIYHYHLLRKSWKNANKISIFAGTLQRMTWGWAGNSSMQCSTNDINQFLLTFSGWVSFICKNFTLSHTQFPILFNWYSNIYLFLWIFWVLSKKSSVFLDNFLCCSLVLLNMSHFMWKRNAKDQKLLHKKVK